MLTTKIYQLDKEHPFLPKVENLFLQFYTGMKEQGLLIGLIGDGEKLWIDSLKQRLGKFSALFVAEIDGDIVGFSTGSMKMLPNFLGSDKVGFVDGIFVKSSYRGTNVGEDLYKMLESWFASKGVFSVELQVLPQNIGGVSFWRKNGYELELYQMRKNISK